MVRVFWLKGGQRVHSFPDNLEMKQSFKEARVQNVCYLYIPLIHSECGYTHILHKYRVFFQGIFFRPSKIPPSLRQQARRGPQPQKWTSNAAWGTAEKGYLKRGCGKRPVPPCLLWTASFKVEARALSSFQHSVSQTPSEPRGEKAPSFKAGG